ncbi:hypothetical protein GGR56DRAFT_654444, partial [Xylariaceae sp. FL0804]
GGLEQVRGPGDGEGRAGTSAVSGTRSSYSIWYAPELVPLVNPSACHCRLCRGGRQNVHRSVGSHPDEGHAAKRNGAARRIAARVRMHAVEHRSVHHDGVAAKEQSATEKQSAAAPVKESLTAGDHLASMPERQQESHTQEVAVRPRVRLRAGHGHHHGPYHPGVGCLCRRPRYDGKRDGEKEDERHPNGEAEEDPAKRDLFPFAIGGRPSPAAS